MASPKRGNYSCPFDWLFACLRADYLDYETALDSLSYLDKEEKYVPWKTALNRLSYLESVLDNRPAFGNFQVGLVSLLLSFHFILSGCILFIVLALALALALRHC